MIICQTSCHELCFAILWCIFLFSQNGFCSNRPYLGSDETDHGPAESQLPQRSSCHRHRHRAADWPTNITPTPPSPPLPGPPAVQSAITCPSQSHAIVFASPARFPEIQVLSFAEMCQSWPIAFKNTLVAIILLTGGTGSVTSQKLAWVVQWVVSPACEVSWFYVQPKYFLALFIPHFLSM